MTSSLNRSLIFAPTTRLPFLMTSSHLVLVVITGGFQYFDAQVDDARHTMSIARTAAKYGEHASVLLLAR